jgi:3-deoxy-D-manno-octulosonate 8-phosphate phosphatase (KDO 8-P phosphatase)
MYSKKKLNLPTNFVIDLDGVFTDGKFYYSEAGKIMKVFGADDNDVLKILERYLKIQVVTADKRGFAISKKRIEDDMNMSLVLVPTKERLNWLIDNFDLATTIYMADGLLDQVIFSHVMYSICPSNGADGSREKADFVTRRAGGDRAVAEACLHIMERFFEPFDPNFDEA